MNPKPFRLAISGDDNPISTSAAAHPHRAARQRCIQRHLATGKKGVAIDM
jgi:hypothetical protein